MVVTHSRKVVHDRDFSDFPVEHQRLFMKLAEITSLFEDIVNMTESHRTIFTSVMKLDY